MRSLLCLTSVLALLVAACGEDSQTCETTADCKKGRVCVQGRCLQPVNPCGSNLDCDFPLECVDGYCIEPQVEGGIILGCNKSIDDKCEADEKPHHIITLSPYEIDPTETTQSAYQSCIDDGGCTAPGSDAECMPIGYSRFMQNEKPIEVVVGVPGHSRAIALELGIVEIPVIIRHYPDENAQIAPVQRT